MTSDQLSNCPANPVELCIRDQRDQDWAGLAGDLLKQMQFQDVHAVAMLAMSSCTRWCSV